MRIDCDAYYLLWFDYAWDGVVGSSAVDGVEDSFTCNFGCAFDRGYWYPLNSNYYLYGIRLSIEELFFKH